MDGSYIFIDIFIKCVYAWCIYTCYDHINNRGMYETIRTNKQKARDMQDKNMLLLPRFLSLSHTQKEQSSFTFIPSDLNHDATQAHEKHLRC